MKLEFSSVDEVLEFTRKLQTFTPGELRPGNIDPETLARVLGQVGDGNKLAALRIYRAVTNSTLYGSKDAVEKFWPNLPPRKF